MKTKTFFFSILFLFLTSIIFTSCENDEEEILLNEEINGHTLGVDKDNERPGSQNSSGN